MSYYDLKFPQLRISKNPHEREANLAGAYDAPFLVIGPQSPLPWLKAVEEMGYYFKRELKFDFAPYSADERFNSKLMRDRVLVFYRTEILEHTPTPRNPKDFTNRYTFFGVIGIRWREWDDSPASWSVPWLWLHPYERRLGLLTQAWPSLLKMFPNPHVEPPLSLAMSAFMKKVGHLNEHGPAHV